MNDPMQRYTPRAKKVALDLPLREALALGHNWVGTEHILLALVRENEGVAARVLMEMGVERGDLQARISRIVSDPNAEAPHFRAIERLMGEVRDRLEQLENGAVKRGAA